MCVQKCKEEFLGGNEKWDWLEKERKKREKGENPWEYLWMIDGLPKKTKCGWMGLLVLPNPAKQAKQISKNSKPESLLRHLFLFFFLPLWFGIHPRFLCGRLLHFLCVFLKGCPKTKKKESVTNSIDQNGFFPSFFCLCCGCFLLFPFSLLFFLL